MTKARGLKDILFFASSLLVFGLILRTLFQMRQLAMIDTEPPPYPIWYPPYPQGMLDFGPILLGHNLLLEMLTPKWYTVVFTFSPFIVAVLSAHWLARKLSLKENGVYH